MRLLAFLLAFSLSGWTCTPAKECEEQPQSDCFCTEQYDPVCGCNSRTYSNACAAHCAGIANYTKGPCRGATPVDGHWRLVRIDLGGGSSRQAPEQPAVSVQFQQGALKGFGDCHYFQGQYVVTERGITIPLLQGGKADCLEHSQLESMFMERLRVARHYRIDGEGLTLDCGDKGELWFERAE